MDTFYTVVDGAGYILAASRDVTGASGAIYISQANSELLLHWAVVFMVATLIVNAIDPIVVGAGDYLAACADITDPSGTVSVNQALS